MFITSEICPWPTYIYKESSLKFKEALDYGRKVGVYRKLNNGEVPQSKDVEDMSHRRSIYKDSNVDWK